MTKNSMTARHSNLRRFFRTLANERFSSKTTKIHIFLHQPIKNKVDISASLRDATRKKVTFIR